MKSNSTFLPLLVIFLTPASMQLQLTSRQFDPLLPFIECLDKAGKVFLRWGFDQLRDAITMELTVNTTGWIGMGFSPNGDMVGADIIIGGITSVGNTYFMDSHSTGNTVPMVDIKKNYILLALYEINRQTVMKFYRLLQSCEKDDAFISTSPIKVIYAYGRTDKIDYHYSQRGTKELNLLNYSPRTTPSNASYFDIVANNFTVPPVNTHSHCWIMHMPALGKKHHIYKIEPVIENADLVYHILLYRCSPHVNSTYEGTCFSGPLMDLDPCMNVMAVWSVGGGAFQLPENAGIAIGGALDKYYYRLEIHYNNPTLTSGVKDNSGLRFHYTPNLRLHDAAILTTGLLNDGRYVIPPNATAFHSYATCNTSVFKHVLSPLAPVLNVFAAKLHTHLAGRKVRVGHFRDKQQIGFLAVDENYNFSSQQTTYLGNIKTLKMGDEMVVECTYETTNYSRMTQLGLSTTEEMCLAFLYYYPAINISYCCSIPKFNEIQASVGAANYSEALSVLEARTWDEDAIKQYQNKIKSLNQSIYVASVNNNLSSALGKIHDLKPTPSVTCKAGTIQFSATATIAMAIVTAFPSLSPTARILFLLTARVLCCI